MMGRQKKFLVELIKPSHYDDQDYIIQWWRGFTRRTRSHACMGSHLTTANGGDWDDVGIDIEVRDETNAFVPVKSGPIFSTVAKLVDALQRAVPRSRDLPMHGGYVFGRKLQLRQEALRLGRELLRGTAYEVGRCGRFLRPTTFLVALAYAYTSMGLAPP
jgi:hypothetical protein